MRPRCNRFCRGRTVSIHGTEIPAAVKGGKSWFPETKTPLTPIYSYRNHGKGKEGTRAVEASQWPVTGMAFKVFGSLDAAQDRRRSQSRSGAGVVRLCRPRLLGSAERQVAVLPEVPKGRIPGIRPFCAPGVRPGCGAGPISRPCGKRPAAPRVPLVVCVAQRCHWESGRP